MAKILSLSSQVMYGHVGNSVTAFVLQRLGHSVLTLPVIVLSNRPGYPAIAGMRLPADNLDAMLEAGLANGWLDNLDIVMSGYLPSAAHAELCARWVARLKERHPGTRYLCDPVLGDEPGGIYIEAEAAEAVRDRLVPLADILTPNCFELSWLTGRVIGTPWEAVNAAQMLGRPIVLATSAPGLLPDCLSNLILKNGDAVFTNVTQRQVLAHGTGDFIAAAFLAHLLDGRSESEALALASAAMEITIEASDGLGELALIDSQERWSQAAPAALHSLPQPEAADCL